MLLHYFSAVETKHMNLFRYLQKVLSLAEFEHKFSYLQKVLSLIQFEYEFSQI